MKTKDRFDLENEIHQINDFSEHINNILAQEEHLTQDEKNNALIGISQLIKIQTTILIDTMSQVLHLDQYRKNPTTPTTQWIPVSQHLPQPQQRVLAYNGEEVFESEYWSQEWEWDATQKSFGDRITHWMPMPEYPE